MVQLKDKVQINKKNTVNRPYHIMNSLFTKQIYGGLYVKHWEYSNED